MAKSEKLTNTFGIEVDEVRQGRETITTFTQDFSKEQAEFLRTKLEGAGLFDTNFADVVQKNNGEYTLRLNNITRLPEEKLQDFKDALRVINGPGNDTADMENRYQAIKEAEAQRRDVAINAAIATAVDVATNVIADTAFPTRSIAMQQFESIINNKAASNVDGYPNYLDITKLTPQARKGLREEFKSAGYGHNKTDIYVGGDVNKKRDGYIYFKTPEALDEALADSRISVALNGALTASLSATEKSLATKRDVELAQARGDQKENDRLNSVKRVADLASLEVEDIMLPRSNRSPARKDGERIILPKEVSKEGAEKLVTALTAENSLGLTGGIRVEEKQGKVSIVVPNGQAQYISVAEEGKFVAALKEINPPIPTAPALKPAEKPAAPRAETEEIAIPPAALGVRGHNVPDGKITPIAPSAEKPAEEKPKPTEIKLPAVGLPATEEQQQHIDLLNAAIPVGETKWEKQEDVSGKPVYAVVDNKDKTDLETQAKKINDSVGLGTGPDANGVWITTLSDGQKYLAISERRIDERGAGEVLEQVAAKKATQKAFDQLIEERKTGNQVIDGGNAPRIKLEALIDQADGDLKADMQKTFNEQTTQIGRLKVLLEERLLELKSSNPSTQSIEGEIRGLGMVDGAKAMDNQDKVIAAEAAKAAEAKEAAMNRVIEEAAAHRRNVLDEYGVNLLKWADTGRDNGDGTISHEINGRTLKDNNLGQREIAQAFSDVSLGSHQWGDRANGQAREYAMKAFDLDNDGKINAEEAKRIGEIALKAGLKVDTDALARTLNTGDINGPKPTQQNNQNPRTTLCP